MDIHVVVQRDEIADVRDVSPVSLIGSHDVAQAESGHEHSRAPSLTHVLKHERQPHDGDVTHVQHQGPRHHHVVGNPLYLSQLEVIVGYGEIGASDVPTAGVQPGRGGIDTQLASHIPCDALLGKGRNGFGHDAATQAGVVAHGHAYDRRSTVKELGISRGVQHAHWLSELNGVCLERPAFALHYRRAAQLDLLCQRVEREAVGGVSGGTVPLALEQLPDDGIRRGKRPGGPGWEPDAMPGQRIGTQ